MKVHECVGKGCPVCPMLRAPLMAHSVGKEKKVMGLSGNIPVVSEGGCANFPKPEVTETEKKECCGSGDCGTGCGLGPVKDGSVQDASGSGLLQSGVSDGDDSEKYLVVFISGNRYVIDFAKNNMTYESFCNEWVEGSLADVWAHREDVDKDFKYTFNLALVESITRH